MEASALSHASRRGLLARRSPVLKLEGDERLVALIRSGNDRAFEVLFDRYQSRLLAFCSSMLKSRQDAEDVLQEVFANAHAAMLADDRKINVRPWLYRIARNRCLNHLRRPVHEGQDSMDIHPHMHGTTTAERVQNREELREVLNDVGTLPETQRTALLLREIDQMSYEEIAVAMDTTIPAVKSLLVRARITLAESSESRTLSCEEVRVTLAEAAEGLTKATGPVRLHVRNCEGCAGFRKQLRSDRKALAAILPIGPLVLLKTSFIGKLFGGGGAAASGGAATGGAVGATAAGGSAAGGIGGGLSAIGGVIGAKAVAGVATAALLTAGAVEVSHVARDRSSSDGPATAAAASAPAPETAAAAPDSSHDGQLAEHLLVAAAGAGAVTNADRHPAATGQDRPEQDRGATGSPDTEAPVTGAEEPVASEPTGDPATVTPAEETPAVVVEDGGSTGTGGRPASDGGTPSTDPGTSPTTPVEPTPPPPYVPPTPAPAPAPTPAPAPADPPPPATPPAETPGATTPASGS